MHSETRSAPFEAGRQVLVVAEGKLPSPGYDVSITQRLERIFPPWYQLLRRSRSRFFSQVVVPYRISQAVDYPDDQQTIRVFHANGADDVTIESCGEELSA